MLALLFVEVVPAFCLLLAVALVEEKLAGKSRPFFHLHAPCCEVGCRYCLKLSKVWFTRH